MSPPGEGGIPRLGCKEGGRLWAKPEREDRISHGGENGRGGSDEARHGLFGGVGVCL